MDQRKNNPPPFVYAWQKRHILHGSREVAAKRCTKKCDARVLLVTFTRSCYDRCRSCFQRLDYSSSNVVTYHRESDFLKACNAM